MDIRPFCNADVPKLLDRWIQHWATFGPPPFLNMAKFEQAVVARRFFRAEQLLVAEADDNIVGWVWTAPSVVEPSTTRVSALCFCPESTEVGVALMQAAESLCREGGNTCLKVGALRDHLYGFAGLDPVGHGFGVSSADRTTIDVLQQLGYTPDRDVVQLTASATEYRVPVSREAMQFRRTTHTESAAFNFSNEREAAAMSHFDVEVVRLLNQTGQTLASIRFWYSDPEAEVMEPGNAIIDLNDTQRRDGLSAPELYLVGSVVSGMERRRVMTVETVVDQGATELMNQLASLRFEKTTSGSEWGKAL